MLQSQTVSASLLALLKQLMAIESLKDFVLVGGTNLALRKGHRISIDIDLFTNTDFDTNDILPVLQAQYPLLTVSEQRQTSLLSWIDDIKVDFIRHNYPYVAEPEVIDGIRLASEKDVIAMKLNAVAQRGARKDFWDIAVLLDDYSIADMLACYTAKYAANDVYFVVRSLTYFEDADNKTHEAIQSLTDMTWEQVKQKITTAVAAFLSTI